MRQLFRSLNQLRLLKFDRWELRTSCDHWRAGYRRGLKRARLRSTRVTNKLLCITETEWT